MVSNCVANIGNGPLATVRKLMTGINVYS